MHLSCSVYEQLRCVELMMTMMMMCACVQHSIDGRATCYDDVVWGVDGCGWWGAKKLSLRVLLRGCSQKTRWPRLIPLQLMMASLNIYLCSYSCDRLPVPSVCVCGSLSCGCSSRVFRLENKWMDTHRMRTMLCFVCLKDIYFSWLCRTIRIYQTHSTKRTRLGATVLLA